MLSNKFMKITIELIKSIFILAPKAYNADSVRTSTYVQHFISNNTVKNILKNT